MQERERLDVGRGLLQFKKRSQNMKKREWGQWMAVWDVNGPAHAKLRCLLKRSNGGVKTPTGGEESDGVVGFWGTFGRLAMTHEEQEDEDHGMWGWPWAVGPRTQTTPAFAEPSKCVPRSLLSLSPPASSTLSASSTGTAERPPIPVPMLAILLSPPPRYRVLDFIRDHMIARCFCFCCCFCCIG